MEKTNENTNQQGVNTPVVSGSFKIEKNKLPKLNKYPWDKMDNGDSFIVNEYSYDLQSSILTAGNHWCKKYKPNCKVNSRKVDGKLMIYMVSR